MIEQSFELKLSDGTTVTWAGTDGENAARRFLTTHPEKTVVAWRYPKYEFKIGMIRIES